MGLVPNSLLKSEQGDGAGAAACGCDVGLGPTSPRFSTHPCSSFEALRPVLLWPLAATLNFTVLPSPVRWPSSVSPFAHQSINLLTRSPMPPHHSPCARRVLSAPVVLLDEVMKHISRNLMRPRSGSGAAGQGAGQHGRGAALMVGA